MYQAHLIKVTLSIFSEKYNANASNGVCLTSKISFHKLMPDD